uniref:Uncharacterized protein n=1 Tax=Cereibacter sphaeroides (strain ATCC 17025 / ATH 2.4.3) TaxID=349102 RepID=A4WUH3_CERS5
MRPQSSGRSAAGALLAERQMKSVIDGSRGLLLLVNLNRDLLLSLGSVALALAAAALLSPAPQPW